MARQLDDCVRYAKERRQFGQSIGGFQAVSNRLAEMKLRLETSLPIAVGMARRRDSRNR